MPKTFNYTVLPGQNTIDIAMQFYGSAEAVFELCRDNNLNIGDDISPGTVLLIDEDKIKDKRLVHYYTKNNTTIASE